MEFFNLSLVFDTDHGFVVSSGFNLKGPLFNIFLNDGVIEFSTDQSFGIEDGVCGVSSDLVFSGVSDQSFGFSESDVRRGGSVTLVVGDDFDSIVLPETNTRIGGT